MTATPRILALALALAAGACTSMPYKKPQIEAMSATRSFTGMRALAAGKPLKVMIVHGMCTHDSGWVQGWLTAMRNTLGSNWRQRGSGSVGAIQTYGFDFTDQGRTIETTFVLWSPATQAAKKSLDYDKSPQFPYKRAKFNDAGKSILIDDCFADPVIYSGSRGQGSVGEAIRSDMAGVVCQFLDGTWRGGACDGADVTTDRAFITESLGSKILFDAVDRVASNDATASGPRAALGRTRAIYMLANQLPLLRLAEARAGVTTSRVEQSEFRWFGAPGDAAVAAVAPAPLQLVVFTDPNDQFGYRLTYDSIGETPQRMTLFNVIVSNARTYFGLAENPYPAHVGYWDNARVPPLVLNGGTATPGAR